MVTAFMVLAAFQSNYHFDETPAQKAGFRHVDTSAAPSPRNDLHFLRIYERDSDEATLSIGCGMFKTVKEANAQWDIGLSLHAGIDSGPKPLPSGRPIGQAWRFYPNPKGGTAMLRGLNGRTSTTVMIRYKRTRKNGLVVWDRLPGDSDLILIETLARNVLSGKPVAQATNPGF